MRKLSIEDMIILGRKPAEQSFNVGDVVINSSKTADDEPAIGQYWIDYWEDISGEDIPSSCPCCGNPMSRDEGNVHGTHVQMNRGLFAKKYIIPTCNGCNGKHEQELTLKSKITGVEAIKK